MPGLFLPPVSMIGNALRLRGIALCIPRILKNELRGTPILDRSQSRT